MARMSSIVMIGGQERSVQVHIHIAHERLGNIFREV